MKREETPAKSPWWLTLLRLALASLLIFAMAGPIWQPQEPSLKADGDIILIVDDGWASGESWDLMKQKANGLLEEAKGDERLVTLMRTTNPSISEQTKITPELAQSLLEGSMNTSIRPDHETSAETLNKFLQENPNSQIVYLSDGLQRAQSDLLFKVMSENTTPTIVAVPNLDRLMAISKVENNPDAMTGNIIRAQSDDDQPTRITGYDSKGLPIARATIIVPSGEKNTEFSFSEPVELRNQIVRIGLEQSRNAGAVKLLDDSNRRRIVGLISGQSIDISQPLLSPLYYINRALAPFSDVRQAGTANIEQAVSSLIEQNISTLVLADIGKTPPENSTALSKWVDDGGMLIRFAGPRLAAKPDADLLPIQLHAGDRLIGGALSWEEPKTLAPFERNSPFYGIEALEEVRVTRQVMAVQSNLQEQDIWARLEDGTPLVTAKKQGGGWLVLFHVNSDNKWSNLPLSGTFVEMLRRAVNLSRSTNSEVSSEEASRLPPLEVINGEGILVPPSNEIKPLLISKEATLAISFENPPGLYGAQDGYVALNLMADDETLNQLEPAKLAGASFTSYGDARSSDLKPWLLALAAFLFIADCIAVLWFAGALRNRPRKIRQRAAASAIVLGLSLPLTILAAPNTSFAQTDETSFDFSSTLRTRLAFVKTGNLEIDNISEAGLRGLTRYITSRTAIEPAEPIGIDISADELAFYPIIYWPIDAASPTPEPKAMARADAYMKQGGTILFDTRDQLSGVFSNSGNSAQTLKLREILADLDIPPLEPVPPDHVLTKSFYLLESFPGRYAGGDLWVEQIGTQSEDENRPARAGDGVSTIMITSNDFAGAWAVDENLQPLFATVPPNPEQRDYAYRVGVNILMYMMTGNYKADQVHIPALLERLGQ